MTLLPEKAKRKGRCITDEKEEKQERNPLGGGAPARELGQGRTYPLEIQRKAIRLLQEEGSSLSLAAQELGIDSNPLWHWKKRYEVQGENGLIPQRGSGRSKLPVAVKERMVTVKKNFDKRLASNTLYW